MKRTTVSVAGIAALAAALVATAAQGRNTPERSPLTSRFSRSAKVWKLSVRNSARFVVMKARHAASPAERPDPACVFSIYPRRSWVLVVVMFVGGVTLRQLPIPRPILMAPYFAMGICLIGGALVYLRAPRQP